MTISNENLLFAFGILTLGIFAVYFINPSGDKKRLWKCKEGRCEQDIKGEYSSLSDCTDSCEKDEQTYYICTKNSRCVEATGVNPNQPGVYSSLQQCQDTCREYPMYTYATYPSYLYTYRRPYYWTPYRNPWRRGGRGRRGRR